MPDRETQALEERVRSFVGLEEGPPFTCPDAVNEPMIRHWCEAMGDALPVYVDAERAKQSVHGGTVAPPARLQVWEMRGYAMHDPKLLAPNKQRELHGVFDAAGYTGVVATDTEQEYRRYLRPGEKLRLGAPNHPGDTMTFGGRVAAKDGDEVKIEVVGRNRFGSHVTATLRVALPD